MFTLLVNFLTLQILQLLIEGGATLDSPNRAGCTALHIAAHKHPARCVQILLSAGTNPNCRDIYGDTALHDSIGKDNYKVVELLCSASGKTNFLIKNGTLKA